MKESIKYAFPRTLPVMAGYIFLGIALCSVVVLHLWKRKTLLSIAVGTMIYMVLLRMI